MGAVRAKAAVLAAATAVSGAAGTPARTAAVHTHSQSSRTRLPIPRYPHTSMRNSS
jgi:hypothetical protein